MPTSLNQLKLELNQILKNPYGLKIIFPAISKYLNANAPQRNDLLTTEGTFNNLKLDRLRLSDEFYTIETNKIRNHVSIIIDSLTNDDVNLDHLKYPKVEIKKGKIVYYIPKYMQLESDVICSVKIAVEDIITERNGESIVEDLRVTETMDVNLSCFGNEDSPFKIDKITESDQPIYDFEDTEWAFFVRAKKLGKEHPIVLKTTTNESYSGTKKDKLFHKTISVIKDEYNSNKAANDLEELANFSFLFPALVFSTDPTPAPSFYQKASDFLQANLVAILFIGVLIFSSIFFIPTPVSTSNSSNIDLPKGGVEAPTPLAKPIIPILPRALVSAAPIIPSKPIYQITSIDTSVQTVSALLITPSKVKKSISGKIYLEVPYLTESELKLKSALVSELKAKQNSLKEKDISKDLKKEIENEIEKLKGDLKKLAGTIEDGKRFLFKDKNFNISGLIYKDSFYSEKIFQIQSQNEFDISVDINDLLDKIKSKLNKNNKFNTPPDFALNFTNPVYESKITPYQILYTQKDISGEIVYLKRPTIPIKINTFWEFSNGYQFKASDVNIKQENILWKSADLISKMKTKGYTNHKGSLVFNVTQPLPNEALILNYETSCTSIDIDTTHIFKSTDIENDTMHFNLGLDFAKFVKNEGSLHFNKSKDIKGIRKKSEVPIKSKSVPLGKENLEFQLNYPAASGRGIICPTNR